MRSGTMLTDRLPANSGRRRYGARRLTTSSFGRRLTAAGLPVCLCLAGASGADAQVERDARFVLTGGVGLQTTVNTRVDRVAFGLFEEVGRFEAGQALGRTAAWDFGIARELWKGFGLGAHVARASVTTAADLDATIPHPFLFGFPRTAAGRSPDLSHREAALHVQLRYRVPRGWTPLDWIPSGWLPHRDRLHVTVFVGPSLYAASQELVGAIEAGERGLPFDEVDIAGHAIDTVAITAVGFNAGFDVSYFGLGRFDRLGLAGSVRFSRAAPGIALREQIQPALELGGTQVLWGLRYAF